jgi:hypothetical protein
MRITADKKGSPKGRTAPRGVWMVFAVAAFCLLTWGMAAQAQTAQAQAGWSYEFDLFGWGAGLGGDVGPNFGPYHVDASFSDLAKYLDLGGMGHFEARRCKWGLMVDAVYVNLGHSADNRFGFPVKVNVEDMILGLEGTYRFYEDPRASFDLTLGVRYNDVSTDLTPHRLPARHTNLSWTDPVLGVKGGVKLGKTWTFGYRADVGGFGTGSDFSTLVAFRLDAKVSQHVGLGFGYLAYKVDYSTGSERKDFVYNTTMQGPFLGVVWRW